MYLVFRYIKFNRRIKHSSFWQEYYSYNSDVIYNSLASMHLQHSTTIFFKENTENLQGLFWLMSSPNIKVCRRFLLANATGLSLFKHVLSKQYKKCDCQQSFIHLQLYWVPGRGCCITLDAFKTEYNANFSSIHILGQILIALLKNMNQSYIKAMPC